MVYGGENMLNESAEIDKAYRIAWNFEQEQKGKMMQDCGMVVA